MLQPIEDTRKINHTRCKHIQSSKVRVRVLNKVYDEIQISVISGQSQNISTSVVSDFE